MKYSITLVKITKNVSGPVSINFVSLASELSLLVLRHDRCFGTIVASAQSLLRHDRCFGTIVAPARSLLRHDRCFGTTVASARPLLRHDRCFGTIVASARAFLRPRESTRPWATRVSERSTRRLAPHYKGQTPGKPFSSPGLKYFRR